MPLRVLAGLLLVPAAAGAWLAWTGLEARDEVDLSKADVASLRDALVAGDLGKARAVLSDARAHADRARDLTGDLLWRAVGALPLVGRTPLAISVAGGVLAQTTDQVLPDLVDLAVRIDPRTLRDGNRVDLARLAATGPAVQRSLGLLAPLQARLGDLNLGWVPYPVTAGVDTLRNQLANLHGDLTAVSTASKVIPPMLGGSGARTYLVVFQNNAESRGTGGLVGAYAVVQASQGRISTTSLGSDSDLVSAPAPVVDLGPAYRELFGDDPALWANTNLSAHFPYAAVQQLALWQRQHQLHLDGVVAVDPVMLGYLLAATGPARLPDGTALTSANIAALTMSGAYARYPSPTQTAARKQFLQAIAGAALTKLMSGAGDPQALLGALGRAARERRLLVYSAHPEEEALIAGTAVSGVVDDTPGPYVGLALDNASGSKIDYYLDRKVAYVRSCSSGARVATSVTVLLRDNAPDHGLPEYVGYRLDRGPLTSARGRGGDGSVLERVLVYLSVGAQVTSATLDGLPLQFTPGTDGAGAGRPVVAFPIQLESGQTRSIELDLTEPAVTAVPPSGARPPIRLWVQPLVRTPITTVTAPSCR